MRVTVFTSNQPRHRALILALAEIADEVLVFMECTTIWPGEVDDFYSNSATMQLYFSKVIEAENDLFGSTGFMGGNGINIMPMKMGDINNSFANAPESDYYICFGCSYIKGHLAKFLISRQAINIHMGLSPYYRGSGCNFWAMYDRRPDMVGATIHRLSKGLDSGDVIQTVKPHLYRDMDGFALGMGAVKSAIKELCALISCDNMDRWPLIPQDKSLELRYSRYSDFTDAVVEEYLANMMTPEEIEEALKGAEEAR